MVKKKSGYKVGTALVNASDGRRRVHRGTPVPPMFAKPSVPAADQLRSVTQESSLEEFFSRATLRGADFAADRLNAVHLVPSSSVAPEAVGALLPDQRRTVPPSELQDRLKMPRRPDWRAADSAERLAQLEQEAFLDWRQGLEEFQMRTGIVLTPFEKNLDIWRQLWRVLEKSDVVVQLMDARNPLMFRVTDLDDYCKELSKHKTVFLLLSKADLLTERQRQCWANYFAKHSVPFAFWSNVKPAKQHPCKADAVPSYSGSDSEDQGSTDDSEEKEKGAVEVSQDSARPVLPETVLNRRELLEKLKALRPDLNLAAKPLVVGMVGYPNVGKSSTINNILGTKKVAVSATPGKTKHLQTIVVDDQLTLCDAPGLVFPAAHFRREHMVLAGILSSDCLVDYLLPIRFLCSVLSSKVFEKQYGLMLSNSSHVDSDGHVDADVLLTALAFMRGFMSAKGIPDRSRAARCIIKDCLTGQLPYCVAPPSVEASDFNESALAAQHSAKLRSLAVLEKRNLIETKRRPEDVDRQFFAQTAHVLSRKAKPDPSSKKHFNRNKREKLRRVFAHLDA